MIKILPHQTWGNFRPRKIPSDLVMGKPLTVVREVGQGVVDLADEQILAIVQTSHRVFHGLTLATYP